MSDIKLFRIGQSQTHEIEGTAAALEKSLQTQIEQNLDTFLGVRFLSSEFTIEGDQKGRIDTLGIDENNTPVIIEFKRASNANVINQGLFYLDWLVTHRGDFEMLVLKVLDQETAEQVDWSAPRLICIAGNFNKFDEHAIKQMNHNIELICYKQFGADLLMLEQVNAVSASPSVPPNAKPSTRIEPRVTDKLEKASQPLKDRYLQLFEYLNNLGDDVQIKTLKHYFAFKRIKNFACVEVHHNKGGLLVFLKINPDSVKLEEGFSKDWRGKGHWGTGDLSVFIKTAADFEKAKPLLNQSYENA